VKIARAGRMHSKIVLEAKTPYKRGKKQGAKKGAKKT